MTYQTLKRVSIPFKRESVSKGYHVQHDTTASFFCFNSLQTGKRIQRIGRACKQSNQQQVSIPFKRESVSKAEYYSYWIRAKWPYVSIPFKRESVSKVF